MAKESTENEVVVKRINTTITERPNGTRITRELTDTLELRPPKKTHRLSGWPLVVLIIFLVLLAIACVAGYITGGI